MAADEADDCVSYDFRAIFGDDGGSELRMRVAMPVLIGWRPLVFRVDDLEGGTIVWCWF